MKDIQPTGEHPKQHSIHLHDPSIKTIGLINYALRYMEGASPWSYPTIDLSTLHANGSHERPPFSEPLVLARATLPEDYPLRELVAAFEAYTYENSPWGAGQYDYKKKTGYEVNIDLPLRFPRPITPEDAQTMLASLQTNSGLGEYHQLKSGKHQIVIPERGRFKEGTPEWVRRAWGDDLATRATVLELGHGDPEQGLRYIEGRLEQYTTERSYMMVDLANGGFYTRYLREYIEKLQGIKANGGLVDVLRIRLKSGERFKEFIDEGDYKQIEGRTKDTGISQLEMSTFLEKAEFLLEAVCDTFGSRSRTPTTIRVEHPEIEETPGDEDQEVLGRPPISLFKPEAGLDDWSEAAGEAAEGNINNQDFRIAAEKKRIRRLNTLAPHQKDLFLEIYGVHMSLSDGSLTSEQLPAKRALFNTLRGRCLEAGIPEEYLNFGSS